MNKMYELREMLVDELNSITSQNKMTQAILETVDKLTHSIKSIDTILAMEESKHRESRDGSYGYHDRSYDGSYGYDRSYAVDRRGRNADGSYRTRMDGGRDQRYSRDLKEKLHHLMKDANPEEKMMIEDWMHEL
jgi:hypothetical protein